MCVSACAHHCCPLTSRGRGRDARRATKKGSGMLGTGLSRSPAEKESAGTDVASSHLAARIGRCLLCRGVLLRGSVTQGPAGVSGSGSLCSSSVAPYKQFFIRSDP